MLDLTVFVQQANRRLEDGDCVGARDLLRYLLLVSNPVTTDFKIMLAKLNAAEVYEHVQFRKLLSAAHPDSLDVLLFEADSLMKNGFGSQAVLICKKLLEGHGLTAENAYDIRRVRYLAARHTTDPVHHSMSFAEDFIFIWKELASSPFVIKARRHMVKDIIQISDPLLIEQLEVIANELGHESYLLEVIKSKIDQLKSRVEE